MGRTSRHFKCFVFIKFVNILALFLHMLFFCGIQLSEPIFIGLLRWRTSFAGPKVGNISITEWIYNMLSQNMLFVNIFLWLHHGSCVSWIGEFALVNILKFNKVKDCIILICCGYRFINFLRWELIKGVFFKAFLVDSHQLTSHIKLTLLQKVDFNDRVTRNFLLIFLHDSLPYSIQHTNV